MFEVLNTIPVFRGSPCPAVEKCVGCDDDNDGCTLGLHKCGAKENISINATVHTIAVSLGQD